MKTTIVGVLTVFGFILSASGQKSVMQLTFTAIDNSAWVKLDSIKIMNRTHSADTMIYWPDTVLVLDYQVGTFEMNKAGAGLKLFQNYPNPVKDVTSIKIFVPDEDLVRVMITERMGRQLFISDRVLEKGYHSFRFKPGREGNYFFSVQWKGYNRSIKILGPASGSFPACSLEYLGRDITKPQLKATEKIQYFTFNPGDKLLYVGYADALQSGIVNVPAISDTFTFQYVTNIPCPETPTVTYEGKVYNTIQVFSQCWLKENLDVGTMINSSQNMQNNGVIEKYCYNNETDSCDIYGGLYLWDEMMQYVSVEGTQGICPPGWHVPTDEEYKLLEGAADSLYRIGAITWNYQGVRGFDAGITLKSVNGWNTSCIGKDLFGYSGLPGGGRSTNTLFYDIGEYFWLWTSTGTTPGAAWLRTLSCASGGIDRGNYDINNALSARCVRD